MMKDAMESVYNYVLCYFYQYPSLRTRLGYKGAMCTYKYGGF